MEKSISNSLIVLASEVVCFPSLFLPHFREQKDCDNHCTGNTPTRQSTCFVPVRGWRAQSLGAGTAVQSSALYQTLAGQKVLPV